MNVSILSATKSLFNGTATSVAFPGAKSAFTVLENHAPIISMLTKGTIVIGDDKGEETSIAIAGGFVEIHANEVTACVELT
ncbi:MAG: F0F1 ATP synthase subunit epsilon [Paludibacteraceae bacterium]|nr:F0F1 ATP synthase subunit epsilon [Paludibacteraceae bacterium]